MNLSKSRYTKGVQCPKMLWMDQHLPQEFDQSVLNQAVLETGSAVGDLAMGYFGPFVEVAFCEGSKQAMLEETERLLDDALTGRGPVNIAEASFAFDGNFCSVDILRVEPDGVHLVEVKSSTHMNPIYYHDMAFQVWVLGKCGLHVKSASLMHLNSGYVRQGELDLQQLFVPEDCSADVFAMVEQVEARVAELKATADAQEEPAVAIGCQCRDPYPCGYQKWCWKDLPSPNVFDLNRMSLKRGFKMLDQGICTYQQALDAGVKLNARQRAQALCQVEGLPQVLDRAAVAAFLGELSFPLYFLDFETFQPAVPPFDGTRPYQQIPTQYSLHVLASADAPLEHYEFLAPAGADPRRAVAEHLVADIPAGACTLAYNMAFEKARIKEIADAFPDLAEHLLAINQGMNDLIKPFSSGAFYLPSMGGSNSIKAVLPALFPNDPSLDYHALEGVHNGSEAMAVYADLENMAPEQAEQTRVQLLKYCELDTLAMVKLWQRLVEVAE